jgi:type II secretory pathway pseudopilin PulG
MRGRNRSYTLIELLIVVAILGLSSVLLVPHLVGRDSMNVQAAVRLMIGDLTFAQSDALAHQELRRVHFYEDGRGYCLTRIDSAELATPFDDATAQYVHDPLATGGELGNYIVDFSTDERFAGVRIASVDIDGDDLGSDGVNLNFDELGGTITASSNPGTGGTIVVEMNDERYEIMVFPFTGKLRVSKL